VALEGWYELGIEERRMTPERQRIAIAEACPGWTIHHAGRYCAMLNPPKPLSGVLFDPLDDLNAMHEAEGTLDLQEAGKFAEYLAAVVWGNTKLPWVDAGSFAHVHATASQRAEAFLRAIGKWEEA
jgi:hypothetical protein